MSLLSLPLRRPVATMMFFVALVMLGLVGWRLLPVELLPSLGGDELYVQIYRPGSEPEVVERELLLPLEARVRQLEGVSESWGSVVGSTGSLRIRFESGVDLGIRELEHLSLANDMVRTQPRGTVVIVSSQDLAALSGGFVDIVHQLGLPLLEPLADRERIEGNPFTRFDIFRSHPLGGLDQRLVAVSIESDQAAPLELDELP